MARIMKDEEIKQIEIFAFRFWDSNEIALWKAKSGSCNSAYRNHVNGRVSWTKDRFEKAKQADVYPEMYVLETVEMTNRQAFLRCIGWAKHLVESGYKVISTKKFEHYLSNLTENTAKIYEEIREIPLEKIFSKNNLIVSNYGELYRKNKAGAKDRIKITVTQDEYEIIRKRAENEGMSMSQYCRNIAIHGGLIKIESPQVTDYIEEVRGVKIILRQILYAYYQGGKYHPADLENIQKMIDKIVEGEKNVYRAYDRNTRYLKKLLPR